MKQYWSMTEGVFNCLIDESRTKAFHKAIRKIIKKGDVVVDMGTGSGVLAMFAAQAGAKKVYAVEYDKNNILTLENTFKLNGFDKIITVLEGDVTKIKLPEKVDVVIGEMIATALIEELQIQAMNNILNYTNEGFRVLLNQYENFADLVSNNEKFYGLKFKVLRYEYPDETKLLSQPLTEKIKYASVDFTKINKSNKINKTLEFRVTKNGIINGVRLSSDTIFHDGSKFTASFAYSYPIILPVEDIKVKKGDTLSLYLKYELCKGFRNFEYKLSKK